MSVSFDSEVSARIKIPIKIPLSIRSPVKVPESIMIPISVAASNWSLPGIRALDGINVSAGFRVLHGIDGLLFVASALSPTTGSGPWIPQGFVLCVLGTVLPGYTPWGMVGSLVGNSWLNFIKNGGGSLVHFLWHVFHLSICSRGRLKAVPTMRVCGWGIACGSSRI